MTEPELWDSTGPGRESQRYRLHGVERALDTRLRARRFSLLVAPETTL